MTDSISSQDKNLASSNLSPLNWNNGRSKSGMRPVMSSTHLRVSRSSSGRKCNRIPIYLGRCMTRERCSEGWAVDKLRTHALQHWVAPDFLPNFAQVFDVMMSGPMWASWEVTGDGGEYLRRSSMSTQRCMAPRAHSGSSVHI